MQNTTTDVVARGNRHFVNARKKSGNGERIDAKSMLGLAQHCVTQVGSLRQFSFTKEEFSEVASAIGFAPDAHMKYLLGNGDTKKADQVMAAIADLLPSPPKGRTLPRPAKSAPTR